MPGPHHLASPGVTHPAPLNRPAASPGRGFAKVLAAAPKKPSHVVPLEPSVFAETWKSRPTETVRVGIRTISEKSYNDARTAAARTAYALHPEPHEADEFVAAYNDALMAKCVGEAATLADNIDEPYFGKMAEDKARLVLTSEGLRTLFQALERATVGDSPIAPQASDEDIARLAEIAPAALGSMAEGRQRRLRRLLAHVLAELA